jgi:tRNA-Thr(GGU) m(6)t(6)A37 methyltransferase TsaA
MAVSLRPIGVIRSRLKALDRAPRQGSEGAPDAWLEVHRWAAEALEGLAAGDEIVIVTWLHQGDRRTMKVHPRGDPRNPLTGVFATRSPDRPNPLGLHEVTVRKAGSRRLRIGPIEAIDGTPVVDIKPVLRFAPPCWPEVIPRIVARDVSGLVSFVRSVFGATGEGQADRPAVMSIGGSKIMISAQGPRPATMAFLYVYVADADTTFRRAVAAGARALEEPVDTPYGDRRAMVEDAWGNVWQIAER